jgi:hypothetical protein
MSTINYTYNVIVDRFRQFAAGHFQLRRFTHGEISQADLEKEAEWPWLHVKPRAINYSPGTRSFQFEIFISDLPRDKEDKTGYQAESITDCSLIFQDLINEIYLGNMFGSDVVLTRPVNSEPFVEQYTHTLTGVTGTIELQLDYDWSACSIPASWNYNTPTDSGSDGWGALQFIESLDQNGAYVSLLNDEETPGNSYYYGTNSSGVKGWHAIEAGGLTCETLPDCATIISIVDDIAALQSDKVDKIAGKGLSTEDYTTAEKSKLAGIQAGAEVNVNADWNATSGDAQILNKPTIPTAITNTSELVNDGEDGINPFITAQDLPSLTGYVPYTGATQNVDLGTHTLSAKDLVINHSSGSGVAASITKGGAGEALTVNKTSGSGNAMSVTGGVTQLSELHLTTDLADAYIASAATWNAKFNLPALTSGSILFSNGTTITQDNANLFWDDTNNRLGVGTTTPSSPLEVNGILTVSSSGDSFMYLRGNTTSNRSRINFYQGSTAYWFAGINTNSNFSVTTDGGAGALGFGMFYNTRNFVIGSNTDAGYKLDVNGSIRATGSISASSFLARATFLNQTLVATANNDVLVGLDIQPTFTNGAFTGVSNIGLRCSVIAPIGANTGSIGLANRPYNNGFFGGIVFSNTYQNYTGNMTFSLGYVNIARFFTGTGNFTLQNSGTFTDIPSARLVVNSTTQGFLPPRMTNAEKLAIESPVAGLVVYDTTLNKLCVRTASSWETITSL